ncbi:hypothetical protein N7468_007908 [Penicillium chermesinum]|uniref:TMEM205-like domain-containing protein n=1 Tax=Penicillium chermesinum TaxID=63820 RepID=A0A9W9NNR7_9EURO|nr:uncharacterized protein N7468_007908 [Penicillium chermesinum]KAJ5223366.1 hypothetical protein N7468_007908 [Penicillium chermesinum]KAJ6155794.1 hypothetical protein N7470_006360 [Penicillium chermesinum]
MAAMISVMGSLLPYHLLSYGTLLGSQLFQSFINTKICYLALSKREFLLLQKKLFPVYFGSQIGLALLTAATHPPFSILSLIKDTPGLISLAVVAGTGALNYYIFGPKTTTTAFVRRHVHDNNENAKAPVDEERTKRANRGFSRVHAAAIHLNAISMVSTVFYGINLAANLLSNKSTDI